MSIRLVQGDVLDVTADALLLTADGAAADMVGAIGRQLRRRVGEDVWEDVLAQLHFPLRPGQAQAAELASETVAFRHVVVAAAFDHLRLGGHAALLRTGLHAGLRVAAELRLVRVATALSTGGRRMSLDEGLHALVMASDAFGAVELVLSCREPQAHARAAGLLRQLGVQ